MRQTLNQYRSVTLAQITDSPNYYYNQVSVAPERINPGCVGYKAPKPCEHVQLSFSWKGGE